MDDKIEFDDLKSMSEDKVGILAWLFGGAKRVSYRDGVAIAEMGGQKPSKSISGDFTIKEIQEAEKLSRPSNMKNGRPIYL